MQIGGIPDACVNANEYVTAVGIEIVTANDTCVRDTPLMKVMSNPSARAQLKAVLKK